MKKLLLILLCLPLLFGSCTDNDEEGKRLYNEGISNNSKTLLDSLETNRLKQEKKDEASLMFDIEENKNNKEKASISSVYSGFRPYKSDRDRLRDKIKGNTSKWYVGGTLHKSSVSNWRNSSYRNKLATCGDWMAVVDNKITMEELLDRAENLLTCIEEAVAMDGNGQEISGNLRTVDIAVGCITLLGY